MKHLVNKKKCEIMKLTSGMNFKEGVPSYVL